MNANKDDNPVQLALSQDQALVLFDWLARMNDSDELIVAHPAERRVLWDIECDLESELAEPFRPDYLKLLEAARERVGQPLDVTTRTARDLLPDDRLPEWFTYPPEFLDLVERKLLNLTPWWNLTGDHLSERLDGLKKRYPSRDLMPFARRLDNDDVACWDRAEPGTVVIIHDYASPGFEDAGRFEDLWAWFRAAVETMIEHHR